MEVPKLCMLQLGAAFCAHSAYNLSAWHVLLKPMQVFCAELFICGRYICRQLHSLPATPLVKSMSLLLSTPNWQVYLAFPWLT